MFFKRLSLSVIIGLILLQGSFAEIIFETSQVDITVAPEFNHTGLSVGFSSTNGSVSVTSDVSWVSAEISPDQTTISLTFSTSNLISSSSMATITAIDLVSTNRFFINASVSSLNITKLIDDPFRSRVYGIQQVGTGQGCVVVLNPLNEVKLGCITAGNKPTDLAISDDGSELLVINSVDETILVYNLETLQLKEELALPEFNNWGVDATTADLAIGPENIIYYTDGAWAPVLRVFDRSSKTVLQSVTHSGYGFGDIVVSSGKTNLFGWIQYGWSAGWAGSYVTKYSINSDGTLSLDSNTSTSYPTVILRDPRTTPILLNYDESSLFVKQIEVDPAAIKTTKNTYSAAVYSITPGGEIAATKTAMYEHRTGNKLLDLPVSTEVQAFTSDYARFVYFDSSAKSLKTLNLLNEIGDQILGTDICPENGSISLSPDQLTWMPVPGVDVYNVYLGTNATEIANADTNFACFIGQVNAHSISQSNALIPGLTYYWRVDPVSAAGVEKGTVYSFTVSLISCDQSEVDTHTVQGHSSHQVDLQLSSDVPVEWFVTADQPWIDFVETSGTSPSEVQILLDASALEVGVHTGEVVLTNDTGRLFSVPITLEVEALNLRILKSDDSSRFVYGISGGATASDNGYLLEIDTVSESITRVTPAGSSVTDIAIHTADNRIYVANWALGALLAINLDSFELERTYAINEVYRIAPGVAGRLVVEEEDQWIDVMIFDTVNAKTLSSTYEREGGGETTESGHYYFHGDSNSSGAQLHKFDLTGDAFSELAYKRVSSASYYGSRIVKVSSDGQRIFWNGSVFGPDLTEEWEIGELIYSCSADGKYAFAKNNIYDIDQQQVVMKMPAAITVSTFNDESTKLVAQLGSEIMFYALSDPLALAVPELTIESMGYDSIALCWTDETLETGFTLQYREADESWTNEVSIAANTTNYTFSGLSQGTDYEVRIKATASALSSDWSSVLAVTTPIQPISTPTLATPSVTATNVFLSWTDSDMEDFFVLQRSADTSSSDWVTLATNAINKHTFTDGAVSPATSYRYRVRAENQHTASEWSNIQTATTQQLPPPATPTGLTASAVSAQEVSIIWTDVAIDETTYVLERRIEESDSWDSIVILPANTEDYSDTNVTAYTEYWYRVRACNAYGDSDYSNEDSATPLDLCRVFEDDFDPAVDDLMWTSISGGIATNFGTGFLTGNALLFCQTAQRYAESIPLDLSYGGTLSFKIRAGNQSEDGWNNDEAGESVALEYSLDGTTWTTWQTLNTVYPALSSWEEFSLAIPAEAMSSSTRLRWRQLRHSGNTFDVWAIEDVALVSAKPLPPAAPSFIISAPNSATSVSIFWIRSQGATSYILERRGFSEDKWSEILALPSTQNYYTDTSCLPKTFYCYRVKARNAGGESACSRISFAQTYSFMEAWLLSNYGKTEASGEAALLAKGQNGIDNLTKYAFNLSAQENTRLEAGSGTKGLPVAWLDGDNFYVEYVRRKSASNPGITYEVKVSDQLEEWETITGAETTTSIDSIWERVRIQDAGSSAASKTRFIKVIVTAP